MCVPFFTHVSIRIEPFHSSIVTLIFLPKSLMSNLHKAVVSENDSVG